MRRCRCCCADARATPRSPLCSGIEERAVHDRAHAALAVLAPRQARELTPERREEIGDYLLGQQASVAERIRTRSFLDSSAPGRAWAKALSAELAPLAGASMPDIPEEAPDPGGAPDAHSQAQSRGPADSASSSAAHATRPLPSSRIGGALLLAAIVAAVVVAIILIADGGGSHKHQSSSASAAGSSTGAGSTAATTGKTKENRRITLTSPDPASKSIGVAEVLSEGSKYAFYLAAEHLPASKGFFYAVWLYNSRPATRRSAGAPGQLQRPPSRWCSPAERRGQVPHDAPHQGDQSAPDAARPHGPQRRVRTALVQELARIHDPVGVELALECA